MGPFAADAARAADDIPDRTSGFGNVAWTVASYRDFPIPRPASLPLLGFAIAGLSLLRRRRITTA